MANMIDVPELEASSTGTAAFLHSEESPNTVVEESSEPEEDFSESLESSENDEPSESVSNIPPVEESSNTELEESVVSTEILSELEISSVPEEPVSESSKTEAENPKIVYWGASGSKYHIDPNYRSFKGEAANSGTISEAKNAGRSDWCGICSKGWTDDQLEKNGNPYAK